MKKPEIYSAVRNGESVYIIDLGEDRNGCGMWERYIIIAERYTFNTDDVNDCSGDFSG